jgi:hypothetical protein
MRKKPGLHRLAPRIAPLPRFLAVCMAGLAIEMGTRYATWSSAEALKRLSEWVLVSLPEGEREVFRDSQAPGKAITQATPGVMLTLLEPQLAALADHVGVSDMSLAAAIELADAVYSQLPPEETTLEQIGVAAVHLIVHELMLRSATYGELAKAQTSTRPKKRPR